MKFRPCIDLHNGMVKQIVGSTLTDDNCGLKENFVSQYDSAYYASMFKKDKLSGGHIIKLGAGNENATLLALSQWKGGMQVGGGITNENCLSYLMAGASHVIVTSYVFSDGKINYDNLRKISTITDKKSLVLDLSCKLVDGEYIIATDRWQKLTDTILSHEILEELSKYCDEFLVHGVSVEGLKSGIDKDLVSLLTLSPIPVTYAGGVGTLKHLEEVKEFGKNRVDITVGSSLDIFGGNLKYRDVVNFCR